MPKLTSLPLHAASILLALTTLIFATIAAAQDYPTKPVRVIIPFPPGAINDTVGRLIATELTNRLGKQFIVDNRAGAGGVVGTELAANAPKDGYTLLVVSLVNTVNPWLYKLNYEPIKSFAPIAFVASSPNILVVNPQVPAKTLAEFIALAKKQPGKNSIRIRRRRQLHASRWRTVQTVGRRRSLARPVPRRRTGHDRRHGRPHQRSICHHSHLNTAGEGRQGERAGRRGSQTPGGAAGRSHRRRGRSAGLSRLQLGRLVAPAGAPPAIVDKLNKEITAIMQSPEMQKQLENQGLEFMSMTPAEFGTFMEKELAKWGRVVKEGGITAQ